MELEQQHVYDKANSSVYENNKLSTQKPLTLKPSRIMLIQVYGDPIINCENQNIKRKKKGFKGLSRNSLSRNPKIIPESNFSPEKQNYGKNLKGPANKLRSNKRHDS